MTRWASIVQYFLTIKDGGVYIKSGLHRSFYENLPLNKIIKSTEIHQIATELKEMSALEIHK